MNKAAHIVDNLLEADPDEVDPKDYVKKLPPREPRMAYAILPSQMLDPTVTSVSPIVVKEGEPGYHQTNWRWNKEMAQATLDHMNAKLGLTPTEAEYVLMSSMFPKKAAKKRLKEAGPDEIDPKGEFMALDPLKALFSQIKPPEAGTASLQVVLKPSHRDGEWVTRIKNADTGGESWGHYFMDYAEAVKDFRARCQQYGIPPEPMEMTAVFEEGPDEIPNPKDALLGTQPSVEHWLKSHGFIYVQSRWPYYHKKLGRKDVNVTPNTGQSGTLNVRYGENYVSARFDNLQELIAVLKSHGMLSESGPDDVDPREYLRALSARDPRIKISFSCTTPESAAEGDVSDSGWIDEEGVSMMPDLIDHEEGVGVVDLAVKFLQKEGATQASASHFHVGVWYSTGYQTSDYRTGEDEERCYHLEGFLPEEEQEIWNRLHQRRVAMDDARYN